jgi:Fe2+ transport system protein B
MSEKINQVNNINNAKNEEVIINIQNQLKKYKYDTFTIMNECKELKSEKMRINTELEETKLMFENYRCESENEL